MVHPVLILYLVSEYHLMTLFPVLVDVYHKEQLVTKEEAQKIASGCGGGGGIKLLSPKMLAPATRIADILDKYGLE